MLTDQISQLSSWSDTPSDPHADPFHHRVSLLLKFGCEQFGLDMGLLTRCEKEAFEVVQGSGLESFNVSAGDKIVQDQSFCKETLNAKKAFGFHKATGTPWERHPAYQNHPLEAYLGVPVFVASKVYGTLCFVAKKPKKSPFSRFEKSLIHLMALWVGGEIDRDQAERDLRKTTQALQNTNKALQDANMFLTSIIENNPNFIFVKDAKDLRYIKFNKAHEGLMGLSNHDMIGKNDFDLFTPDEARFHVEKDRQVLKERKILDIPEEPIFTKHMGKRILHTKKVPIYDSQGRPEYLLGISEDITEKINLEEQLRQSQKLEAIGKIVGGIAHDFNNIMTGVLGFSSMLLSQAEGKDRPFREGLEEIKRESEHATSLIQQLLAFCRKQVLKTVDLSINDLIQDSQKMIRNIVPEHVEMTLNLDPHLWTIKGDPTQINQVLINVIINARDAMPEGGRLHIKTQNVFLPQEKVTGQFNVKSGDYVSLRIKDSGVGMDKNVLSHIFDPFFTTKERGNGTGLGLSTVFGIVKQSGGHFDVKSKVGKGTHFTIYFPKSSTGSPELPASFSVSTGGQETLLIVEDWDIVRKMARITLTQKGYHVLDVNNPLEALALCKSYEKPIHLLLTDVVMPHMNGYELAKRVQSMRPTIRTLYMSGYTEDFKPQGVDGHASKNFLAKPMSPEILLRTVRQVLDEGREPSPLKPKRLS